MSQEKEYKSPTHKLVNFFKKSRDKWKSKAQGATYDMKLKNNRITFLETSKATVKAKNQELQEENARLKEELSRLKSEHQYDIKKRLANRRIKNSARRNYT